MRTNWKGFALGFLCGGLLCGALAANHLPRGAEPGRFAIAISDERAVIVDTATGQPWSYKFPDKAGHTEKDFFGPKLKADPGDRAPEPPGPNGDPSA